MLEKPACLELDLASACMVSIGMMSGSRGCCGKGTGSQEEGGGGGRANKDGGFQNLSPAHKMEMCPTQLCVTPTSLL